MFCTFENFYNVYAVLIKDNIVMEWRWKNTLFKKNICIQLNISGAW